MYYNPDSTAGGQIVYNKIPFELIYQASERTDDVKEFFEYIDSECKQYLIDKGTPDFESNCEELMKRALNVQGRTENAKIGLNGRWAATMEKMQKYALSQILFDRADAEQQAYIHYLKGKTPDIIIDLSYRKATRDGLLYALMETDLSVNQLKNLLRHECPLEACYKEWIKSDLSLDEVLKAFIQNCADNKF